MPDETEITEAPAATEQEVTLAEFCTNLSKTDRRVELIAGFHADERASKRVKSTASDFSARYAKFISKPV